MRRFAWTAAGRLIPEILAAWQKQMDSPIQKVRGVWRQAVGSETAAHTFPLAFRNGLLIISVDSPVWKAELAQFQREKIIGSIRKALSSQEIRDLRFVTRPGHRSGENRHAGAADKV